MKINYNVDTHFWILMVLSERLSYTLLPWFSLATTVCACVVATALLYNVTL